MQLKAAKDEIRLLELMEKSTADELKQVTTELDQTKTLLRDAHSKVWLLTLSVSSLLHFPWLSMLLLISVSRFSLNLEPCLHDRVCIYVPFGWFGLFYHKYLDVALCRFGSCPL